MAYTLPADAPKGLVGLLGLWQGVSKSHVPTQGDFVFDDLVNEHPGLLLVEPTENKAGEFDLKIVRVGPELKERSERDLAGLLYSETLSSQGFARAVRIYPKILATGEPHYWEVTSALFGAPPVQYARLLLPLYDSKGDAVSMLGCIVWIDSLV